MHAAAADLFVGRLYLGVFDRALVTCHEYANGVPCVVPFVETHVMLFLYRKNEQGDLTPAQVRILAKLVREEFR